MKAPSKESREVPWGRARRPPGTSVVCETTRDNGKSNGNYYIILGLYRDNGKGNGNYYSILGVYWGYIGNDGKSNGNYYTILGVYRDNRKENGNYCN